MSNRIILNEQNEPEKDKEKEKEKPSFVYLLVSTDGATYIGATVDLDHRLRQHNKELVGGAFATSAKVNAGEIWTRVCHVAGFPNWRSALQFEWRWKQISRQVLKTKNHNKNPMERRAEALRLLLLLDRPTTKAVLYTEWSQKPQVIVEIDTNIFNKCISDKCISDKCISDKCILKVI
jgi:predicted GIY-YIG superfamily endonuclease